MHLQECRGEARLSSPSTAMQLREKAWASGGHEGQESQGVKTHFGGGGHRLGEQVAEGDHGR